MFYDVICYVQSTSALSPFFFGVCLPIDQVAEKSKRKTDAVEDPQIRGGNGWLNGKNRGLIMVNIVNTG